MLETYIKIHDYFNETIEVLDKLRLDSIYNNFLGIEPASIPFKPYNTSSFLGFFSDLGYQAIINPVATAIASCFVIFYAMYATLEAIVISMLLYFNVNEPNSEMNQANSQEQGLTGLIGILYFAIHMVVDPLWELLAVIMRGISTIYEDTNEMKSTSPLKMK